MYCTACRPEWLTSSGDVLMRLCWVRAIACRQTYPSVVTSLTSSSLPLPSSPSPSPPSPHHFPSLLPPASPPLSSLLISSSLAESTLQINDELNTVFVRYERWLRNMEAAKSGTVGEEAAPPVTTQVANGVATTSLTEVLV